MFTCYFCPSIKCKSLPRLLFHTQLRHKSVNKYMCSSSVCLRSFNSFRTFKNHFNSNPHNCHKSQRKKKVVTQFIAFENGTHNVTDSDLAVDLSYDNLYDPSCSEVKEDVSDAALAFACKLSASPSLTRSAVQEVVEGVSELFGSPHMTFLKRKVCEILKNNNAPVMDLVKIKSLFEAVSKPFDGLESDYLRIEALKETDMFVAPVSFTIGSEYKTKKIKQAAQLVHCNVYGQHVPMGDVLKKVLQLPDALSVTLENYRRLMSCKDQLSNVVQGSLWQEKVKKFGDKIVLPLLLYFDDFEPDNALGSHATHHKIGALYYSIACFPKECISKIENMFLGLFFLSENKVFSNERVFKPIIDDLIMLERDGIEVNGQRIYFCLASVLGDNLGIHEMLGFVCGFSANYPCRICRVHREVLHTQTRADPTLLRNSENYFADLNVNDVSRTGVAKSCAFNRIPSYGDPTMNPYCDIMHDIAEGAAKYDMGQIVHHIVVTKKYVSLLVLNERIRNFDYSLSEAGNALPPITEDHLKKKKIKFHAMEMLTFVRYFGLMVGDYIPADDSVWEFYLLFREIVDILMSPTVDRRLLTYLKTLISEHHEMYVSLFDETLKPKMHNMLHYVELLLLLGSLVNIWCTRWESKHRPGKIYAHIANSRINLPYTLAIKHQLTQCYRFFSCKQFLPGPVCGPSAHSGALLRSIEDYREFSCVLPAAVRKYGSLTVRWAIIKGTKYEPNMALVLGFKRELPFFGLLKYIVPCGDHIYFIMSALKTIGFDSHVYSYEVALTTQWRCVMQDNLYSDQPLKIIITPRTGKKMITTRFKL